MKITIYRQQTFNKYQGKAEIKDKEEFKTDVLDYMEWQGSIEDVNLNEDKIQQIIEYCIEDNDSPFDLEYIDEAINELYTQCQACNKWVEQDGILREYCYGCDPEVNPYE